MGHSSRSFVAYEDLGDRPNIVVDGAGNPATLITLSHWPKSGTPRDLKADSSAEIVFNFLDAPEFDVEASAVSNNHYDEDGLVGIYALLRPEEALPLRDLLVAVAHAGDFGTFQDRRAARIAFTLSAFAAAETSPLDASIFTGSYPERCAALYQALLPRFGEILSAVERFEEFWAMEDQALAKTEKALRDGAITIEEIPEADLAVVRVAGQGGCHPMAVHNASRCNRVLTLRGGRYLFRYRYESWVQYMSRPITPRADLTPLAQALTEREESGGGWIFDGVHQITPGMRLEGAEESSIPPDSFVAALVDFLKGAQPAWDPYDPE